jgi:hypothetical protein
VQNPGLRPAEEQERGRVNHSTLGVFRTSPEVTSPVTRRFSQVSSFSNKFTTFAKVESNGTAARSPYFCGTGGLFGESG